MTHIKSDAMDSEPPASVRLADTLLGMNAVLLFLLSIGPAVGGLLFSGLHVMIPGLCGLLLAMWAAFLTNRMRTRMKWVRINSMCWAGTAVCGLALMLNGMLWERDANIVLGTIFCAAGFVQTIPILAAMLTPSARDWFN